MTTPDPRTRINSPTVRDLYDLPPTVPVVTAGAFWGLGRDVTRRLVQEGAFPIEVLVLGNRHRCTRAAMIQALDPDGIAKP